MYNELTVVSEISKLRWEKADDALKTFALRVNQQLEFEMGAYDPSRIVSYYA